MNINALNDGYLAGFRIVEARQIPRYRLPREVLPGIPWPIGFLADFDDWAAQYLGHTSILPPGQMYVTGGNTLMMNPSDIAKLKGFK